MKKALVPAVVAMVLMGSAAVSAYVLKPTEHLAKQVQLQKLEELLPVEVGEWKLDRRATSGVVNPQQEAFIATIYDETLSRTYMGPNGERIMVSLAFGADQSKDTQVHRPEVCYPAQGFQISYRAKVSAEIDGYKLPVMNLVAEAQERIEPITYWIVLGDRVVRGSLEQKIASIQYSASGVIPYGLLFRVSSIGRDKEREFNLHQRFMTQLYESVGPDARLRLFGRAGAGA